MAHEEDKKRINAEIARLRQDLNKAHSEKEKSDIRKDIVKQQKQLQSFVKEKKKFIIKVEGTVPVTLEYSVLAENEDEAYKLYNASLKPIKPPKIELTKLLKKRISIQDAFSALIKWTKTF